MATRTWQEESSQAHSGRRVVSWMHRLPGELKTAVARILQTLFEQPLERQTTNLNLY